jgi:hypothetical protein
MLFHLRPVNFFFWALAITVSLTGLAFSGPGTSAPIPHSSSLVPKNDEDTVKYRGYRLDLTDFEIVKRTADWVKIRFNIVNSGRVDVDFSKKGTEHWVQINFDQTIFSNKLGGLRGNIRQVLYKEEFKLAVGKSVREKELKVPVIVEEKAVKPSPPVAEGFETKVGNKPAVLENQNPAVLTGKGGEEESISPAATVSGIAEDCPDIYFQRLRIIKQNDKTATLEYAIANKGHGPFQLFDKGHERVLIKSFISGVPILSRGALPIGDQTLKPQAGKSGELQPGDIYTGQIEIDVRKKTRYMKSLILSLDSDQFRLECDKTNNTGAVILD